MLNEVKQEEWFEFFLKNLEIEDTCSSDEIDGIKLNFEKAYFYRQGLDSTEEGKVTIAHVTCEIPNTEMDKVLTKKKEWYEVAEVLNIKFGNNAYPYHSLGSSLVDAKGFVECGFDFDFIEYPDNTQGTVWSYGNGKIVIETNASGLVTKMYTVIL